MAGAAGIGGTPGAGSAALGIGRGGELVAHLGGTGAHQLLHLFLVAGGTLHFVIAEDQLLKLMTASLTTELKNGHGKQPLLLISLPKN
jgi:hypothetical protein